MFNPKLNITLFCKKIHSFHFFGVLGYLAGVLLGVAMCILLHLHVWVILIMSLTSAATFFLLAFAAKIIKGEETIVYYHHEIGIMLFCTLTLYLLKLPVLQYLDIVILGIGTFLSFGRIGCYSVGCCHGRPHRHGVSYGQAHVNAGFTWFYKDIPLVPVQLIEAGYVFFTVAGGIFLLLSHAAPGTVLIVYTVVYGFMRFAMEFFRGDAGRALWHGLSEAQWTTLILTALTYIMAAFHLLPVYPWHLIILLMMAAAAAITVYYFYHYPEHKLFSPIHIKQIAEGLQMLEAVNKNVQKIPGSIVKVYNTNFGLAVSGSPPDKGATLKCYTVSFKEKVMMPRQSADKIAKLIKILDRQPDGYDIIEKQNGIYHILFKEKKIMDSEAK